VSDATAKKEQRRKFQAIRGTRDLLPPETALWNRVEQTVHEVFTTFGFGEIRVPIFETTDLFARAVGGETDIVSKEMYAFLDQPDLSDLENARNAVKELNPGITAAGKQELFELYVSNFISEIHKHVTAQDINLPRRAQSDFDTIQDRFRDLLTLPDTKDEDTNNKRRHLTFEIVIKVDLLRFGESISLRPEATASVCRAYIEHNMLQLPQPVKLFYTGPMFRRERPQKGRYRQFYQIGAEVLEGTRPEVVKDSPKELSKDAVIDAEVIEMLMTFFDKVGLQGATLYINSIGHNAENCRRGYVELLRAELQKEPERLGEDSQRRIDTNPLRVLDSKLESEQAIIATLPHIADHLCDECKTHYAAVKRQLELRGVLYQENWRLVRGLDYYMRTTFEITAPGLGSQNAVCGGGRYDGLVELLGGPPTKGIGFAIGEDRLILSLQESGKGQTQQGRDVYIAWMGERAYAAAIRAARDLRSAGFSVELPPVEQKFGKALSQADKLGAKYALILGDNEVSEALWTLKTLSTGEQEKFPEPELIDFLRQQKNVSS